MNDEPQRRSPYGFSKGVNEYYNHYITMTDAKAAAIMAASGVGVGVMVGKPWGGATGLAQAFLCLSIGLFIAAVATSACVIFPRLPSGRRGVIFWEDVRAFKSLSEYQAEVGNLDAVAVEMEYAAQNYFVSAVVHRKMYWAQRAIGSFVAAVVFAALVGAVGWQ